MMINAEIDGISFCFKTDVGIFSPRHIDEGTLTMLRTAQIGSGDKVLDLGCGYGAVGIILAKKYGCKVIMSDIDCRAVEYARENCLLNGLTDVAVIESDGFIGISQTGFSAILSNPPYHTDFSVAKSFIEKSFNRLKTGGRLYMVTKRRDWYKNKLIAIFGGVKIHEAGGYFVFCAEKRGHRYADGIKSL